MIRRTWETVDSRQTWFKSIRDKSPSPCERDPVSQKFIFYFASSHKFGRYSTIEVLRTIEFRDAALEKVQVSFYSAFHSFVFFLSIRCEFDSSIWMFDFSSSLINQRCINIFRAQLKKTSASLLIRFFIADNAQLKSLESFKWNERYLDHELSKAIKTPRLLNPLECNGSFIRRHRDGSTI